MIKRIISIENPYHLSVKDLQLTLTDKNSGEIRTTPVEDLGFLVIDHPQTSISKYLLQELAANNVAVVFTDRSHMPSSMLFHLSGHYIQQERFRHQVSAKEPLKKQLWQQTIQAKIQNQGLVLKTTARANDTKIWEPMTKMAADVKSGDNTAREAKAARYYWPKLFGEDFKRERSGMPPNNVLNYGYAIVRAAVARALTTAGLLPTLGIHHHSRYNDFCLADDIMEPYRPFVDMQVWEMREHYPDYHNLDKEKKAILLNVLNADCLLNDQKSPLQVAMLSTTAQLAKCFEGKAGKLTYPELAN